MDELAKKFKYNDVWYAALTSHREIAEIENMAEIISPLCDEILQCNNGVILVYSKDYYRVVGFHTCLSWAISAMYTQNESTQCKKLAP